MIKDPRRFALLATLLGGMGQGVVAPKLPELLHGSTELFTASGLSATLMYLGIFVSTFGYGRAADRGRVRVLFFAGLVGYAATLLALGVIQAPAGIYAARFFEGLALSAIFVGADFVLGRASSEGTRAQWLAYYGVALSVGLLLGPLVALAAARLSPSPLLPLAVVATVAVVLAPFGLAVKLPALPGTARDTGRLPLAPLASGAAYGCTEAALVAVFPVLAVRAYHVTPEYCLVAVIVTAAAASVVWGWLADRKGARLITRALLVALTLGSGALAMHPGSDLTAALGAAAFFGVLAGGLYPVGFAWLLETVPASRYGAASGSFARAYGLGSLVGPGLAGWLAQTHGPAGLFITTAAAGLAGLVLGLDLIRRRAAA